jgi:hypothetical protein
VAKKRAKNAPIICPFDRFLRRIIGRLPARRSRAKNCKKNDPRYIFKLTIQDIKELWIKQRGCCAETGVVLRLARNRTEERAKNGTTASLDRLHSKRGYLKCNVQLVHVVVQLMKNILEPDEFRHWCLLVTAFRNKVTEAELMEFFEWKKSQRGRKKKAA